MHSQVNTTVVMESVEEYNDPIKTRVKQLLGKENNWFRNCIFSELQALQLMRLKGFPSEDTIIPVAYLWVEALWDGKKWELADRTRIAKAFLEMRKSLKEWPQPATFFEFLPKKAALLSLAAPPPQYDKEKAAANLAFIRQSIRSRVK